MKMYSEIILIVIFVATTRASFPPELVQTEYGPVKGYKLAADGDLPYMSYRGVPYAAQPIGNLRFQPLQPPSIWTEPFDAVTEGPVCPQNPRFYGVLFQPQGMDEACIHVNVHVPLNSNFSALPVYVYIHGGGFSFGSGDSDVYGPEFLVTKDIILVTFNYRLNILGFLSLDTSYAPGNLGLKDVTFLLQWVQRNIAKFGGDPSNVTIGGHSAGAAACQLLAFSPMGEGLFNRMIMESGGGIDLFANTTSTSLAYALADSLSIDNSTPSVIFNELKAMPWKELMNALLYLSNDFFPVIETSFEGVEAFLTEDSLLVLSSGNAKSIPQIAGMTDGESGVNYETFEKSGMMATYANNPSLMIPNDIKVLMNEANTEEIENKIYSRYFGGVSNITAESIIGYLELITENGLYTVLKSRKSYAKYLPGTTYYYIFSYIGEQNILKEYVSGSKYPGAVHGDDLGYEFRVNSVNESFVAGSTEEMVKDLKVDLYANFIRTGVPTTNLINLDWPTLDKNDAYLKMDSELKIAREPLADIVEFYDEIYKILS